MKRWGLLIFTISWLAALWAHAEEGTLPATTNLRLNAESATDLLYVNKGETKGRMAHETVLYSGLHLGRRHALHLSGRYFSDQAFAGVSREAAHQQRVGLSYALYQYGKLYHDPLQISIGKHTLPFGVERQPLLGFFSLFHPRAFWAGPDLGINLTVSNTRSLFFQVGAFTEKKSPEEGRGLKNSVQAYTGRIFFDKPSWQGSKVIVSLYGHREGENRLGMALVNANSEQRVVQFEFIRSFYQGKFWNSDFSQLLRLWLQSAKRNRSQFFIIYDDQLGLSRFASVGGRYFFKEIVSLQLAVTYHKSETSEKQIQWGMVAGIGAAL